MREYKSHMKGIPEEEKLGLNNNQLRIIYAKYLKRDADGNVVEYPLDMFKRIAKEIAGSDALYKSEEEVKKTEEEFLDMLTKLDFIPGGRTIANAGTPVKNLANCDIARGINGIFNFHNICVIR